MTGKFFQYFYSDILFQRIETRGLRLTYTRYIVSIELNLYCRNNNIASADVPANWREHTHFAVWRAANPDRPMNEFSHSVIIPSQIRRMERRRIREGVRMNQEIETTREARGGSVSYLVRADKFILSSAKIKCIIHVVLCI